MGWKGTRFVVPLSTLESTAGCLKVIRENKIQLFKYTVNKK